MDRDLFGRALGVAEPWCVAGVDFNESERQLTIRIDFRKGSRFAHDGDGGAHPVHDTSDQAVPASQLLPARVHP